MEETLHALFSEFKGRKEELIPLLQAVQGRLGFLPKEALLEVSRFIQLPESQVFGVATFYTQFRFSPVGKTHIMACRGTACHVRGAPRILKAFSENLGIKEGETTPDLEYSLETVACIGACGLAPCATINTKVEGQLTPKRVAGFFTRRAKNEFTI